MDGSFVIMEGSMSLWFSITPLDGGLVIKDNSLLFIFLLLQWMVALRYGRYSVDVIFVTLLDGSLDIMEVSLLFIILLIQSMVALSLWMVVYFQDFFYSIGW